MFCALLCRGTSSDTRVTLERTYSAEMGAAMAPAMGWSLWFIAIAGTCRCRRTVVEGAPFVTLVSLGHRLRIVWTFWFRWVAVVTGNRFSFHTTNCFAGGRATPSLFALFDVCAS